MEMIDFLTDNGKLAERLGRKAMDLKLKWSHDRHAAEDRIFLFLKTGNHTSSEKKCTGNIFICSFLE